MFNTIIKSPLIKTHDYPACHSIFVNTSKKKLFDDHLIDEDIKKDLCRLGKYSVHFLRDKIEGTSWLTGWEISKIVAAEYLEVKNVLIDGYCSDPSSDIAKGFLRNLDQKIKENDNTLNFSDINRKQISFAILMQHDYKINPVISNLTNYGIMFISVPNKDDIEYFILSLSRFFNKISLYVFLWDMSRIWIYCRDKKRIMRLRSTILRMNDNLQEKSELWGDVRESIKKMIEAFKKECTKLGKCKDRELLETKWISENISEYMILDT